MNKKRNVWLPPDGDPRLVRFQQDAAAVLGLVNGASVPPYLELSSPAGRPQGAVRLGGWALVGEPVLEAFDDLGPVGVVRFSFGAVPPTLVGLPVPPEWCWNRGVTAVLDLTVSDDGPSFLLWSWSSRRGWKSDPPRG